MGSEGRRIEILTDVSFSLNRGERVALVGESGSGKSVTGRAIMRLDNTIRLQGSIYFDGRDILSLPEEKMAGLRGDQISMVFQDPLTALDPLKTIGYQVAEPLRIRGVGRREARARVLEILEELQIPNARSRMRAYPHEFSGGMRQRVVLAMALINNPSLLIADEPTTALDVRVQAQVLRILEEVTRERGLATLFITHDLGVVSSFADRALVMYSGTVVESASTQEMLGSPCHPYTVGLIGASPRMNGPIEPLVALPGTPPHPSERPTGCPFFPRCPLAVEKCKVLPPELLPVGPGHTVACHVVHDRITSGERHADS
ncbi:MAG: ABC transporter ATP-binding protein [Microbacteriaceae bacterium]|nr:MAG: ABC transporter ATP-binding protein [Microbacteriaceae bacterium]